LIRSRFCLNRTARAFNSFLRKYGAFMSRLQSLLVGSLALAALAFAGTAARAADNDMDKFVPAGADYYVHVNLKQMCGASMIRKVVPKLLDKYGENLIKMAAAQNPQVAMAEAMWPQFQEMLRDQDKVDQFFDMAADNIDGFIVAGNAKDS